MGRLEEEEAGGELGEVQQQPREARTPSLKSRLLTIRGYLLDQLDVVF